MKKMFPNDYKIFPRTFIYPQDDNKIKAFLEKKETKPQLILKHRNEKKGNVIVNSWEQANEHLKNDFSQLFTVQALIDDPYLFNGSSELDITLFVMVKSCKPLVLFLHSEGIVFS